MSARVDLRATLSKLQRLPSLVVNLDGDEISRLETEAALAAAKELLESARVAHEAMRRFPNMRKPALRLAEAITRAGGTL